jgi:hypothetical protein
MLDVTQRSNVTGRVVPPPVGWKDISATVLEDACVYEDARGYVHLPCRNQEGEVLRERIVSGSRRWWGPGSGVHLFGVETLPGTASRPYCGVLLTEGESDALAAREAFDLHEDRVAVFYVAVSCPGANAWQPEWRELFEDIDVIYVVGDGDAAGSRFTESVRRSLPWARPVFCPEGRDLRSLLQEGEFDLLISLLDRADQAVRLEDAFLHAPDLATAERWLGRLEGLRHAA